MAKAIVFTSGKGGVGKSTLTLGVGRALALLGCKVVLLDTDIGLNNLDVMMNMERNVVFDITDVIDNRCRLSQALINAGGGLFLLPSAHNYEQCSADGQCVREVVSRLKSSFDYVLIDCPAGIEYGFHRAVAAADEAVVVTTAHLSALKDASKVAALIASYRMSARLVLNRVRGDMMLSGETLSVEEIADAMGASIAGIIPEDDGLNKCEMKKGEGANAIKLLARNLHFGTNELFDTTKKYRGFFGGIKRKLRRKL